MAKKLNKKVVIISSVVLAVFLMGAIVVFLRFTQDPRKFVREGDAALQAKDYESAERNYGKAFALTKTTPERVRIAFKLADLFVQTNEWPKAAGVWNRITTLDPKNMEARQSLLNYFYEMADSGQWARWTTVESSCSEMLELQPGAELYLHRGRARYETGKRGQTIDREKTILAAIKDLEEAEKLEPNNIDVYWYLAQSIIAKGEILALKGATVERDKAIEQAKQILQRAIDIAPANPTVYTNLMSVKLLAARDTPQMDTLESEYKALTKKFGNSPEVFYSLATFYLSKGENFDSAAEAIKKAIDLDKDNVEYALTAANLYYLRAHRTNEKGDVDKATEIARNALELPQAQDRGGPHGFEYKVNRLNLYMLLANCYIEQALSPDVSAKGSIKQDLLSKAEQAVHEIQQIYGTRENPRSVMWEGMLTFAKGQEQKAISQMYAAYEQLKAQSGETRDIYFGHLSYMLASIFAAQPEIGACAEFLRTAIEQGLGGIRPEILLDYADVLLQMNYTSDAINIVKLFEANFSPNDRSRMIYARASASAGLFDEAEKRVGQMSADDPNVIRLKVTLSQLKISRQLAAMSRREIEKTFGLEKEPAEDTGTDSVINAEIEKERRIQAELVEKLLLLEPNYAGLPAIMGVCGYYVQTGQIERAKDLVDRSLAHSPNDTSLMIYRAQLNEPEPNKISAERYNAMVEEVLSSINNPLERHLKMGAFYLDTNNVDKAVAEYNKAIAIAPSNPDAIMALFEIGLQRKDFALANKMVQVVRENNLDGCEGQLFEARVLLVQKQYQEGLSKLDFCLKQRPVSSYVHLYRSIANEAIGNTQGTLENAQKAASLNPADRIIARQLAAILVQRASANVGEMSPEQFDEAKSALLRAVSLNPTDSDLTSAYASFIHTKQPLEALAYQQRLQKFAPTLTNSVRLGNLASSIALEERDQKRKQVLLDIAGSAFEQAYKMDPNNKLVLTSYAEFYRNAGQNKKAEDLVVNSGDKGLVWWHYTRTGQFDDAKQILDELYHKDSRDINTIKGLLIVAEKTGDKDSATKYSEELIALENTPDNLLYQIQVLLNMGVAKQAESKLQSFKEKYPVDNRALHLEALLFSRKGQFDKALKLTNKILEGDENNGRAWYLRGELNFWMGDYAQAIKDLQKSKSINPEPQIRVELAKAYLRSGRVDEAITELTSAKDEERGPTAARYILEQVYQQVGKKQDLMRLYAESLKKYPEDVYWHSRAANFLLTQNNFEQAAQLYYVALENSQKTGGNIDAFDGYLNALRSAKQYQQLLRTASRYIDSNFAPAALTRIAEAKFDMGDKVAAEEYFQKALEKAEKDTATSMKVMERMYTTLGREQTENWCKRKLQSAPDSMVANLGMYNIVSINNEYNKAIDYMDNCIKATEPNSEARETFLVYKANTLIKAYAKTSDNQYFVKAVAVFEKLLEKSPNNTSILNNLSFLLSENDKDLPKALEYAKRAHDLAPYSRDILDTYAYALYKNGQYEYAAEVERAAIQLFEEGQASAPAEAYGHLGMILEKTGKSSEALAAYKQALEVGKDSLSPKDKKRISEAVERLSHQTSTK